MRDVVQIEPHTVAVVQWLHSTNSKTEAEVLQTEMDCWKTLQEVVWLCVEVMFPHTISDHEGANIFICEIRSRDEFCSGAFGLKNCVLYL